MSLPDPSTLLSLVARPTRIIGIIPELFGCTVLASFSIGFIGACLGYGGFFLGLFLLILGLSGSLWLTIYDEDVIRILWAKRFFRNKIKVRHGPRGPVYSA